MADSLVVQQIVKHLERLPFELQRRVLDFTQALSISQPRGTPGRDLARFSGVIDEADAQQMSQAIEDGCERVDPSER